MEFHLISNEFLLLYENIKSDYPVITSKFLKKASRKTITECSNFEYFHAFFGGTRG